MTSDLVTARHLCRKAVIYIRQSTPHQVISNQESLRLQYACASVLVISAGRRPTSTWSGSSAP